MLSKLLKYELKSSFKFLGVFYTLSILFSVLTRVFLNIENSMVALVIGEIFKGAAISMMFSILINNTMRLWVLFRTNLYGDESYLTHTLPIEKSTIYLSKILNGVITLFVSVILIASSIVISFYSKKLFEALKTLLVPFAENFDSSVPVILSAFVFILFLEFLNILQCGFTGIISGHKRNNAKTGFSVLWGFIAMLSTQFVVLFSLFIISLFDQDFMNMFITNTIPSANTLKTVIILSVIIYSAIVVFIGFLNIKLLKQGVNVD